MSYLNDTLGEVPKRLKGHPWKGCRSVTRREGSNPSFSVHIIDVSCFWLNKHDDVKKIKISKKLLTNNDKHDILLKLSALIKNAGNNMDIDN